MKTALRIARMAIVVLLVAPAARADDDLERLLAQPIVSTASHTPETANVAPGTVTVLSADDLRRYGIHTIAEALDFLSIGVASSRSGNEVELGARGVGITDDDGDHFLLLIDGHAVNEPVTGGASFGREAGVPMEMVDHIEVIVGPGSVLYGTGAMLGVVNVITKSADGARPYVLAEGGLGPSYRLGAGGGTRLSLFGRNAEVTGGVEYFQNDGLPLALNAGAWGGIATQTTYQTAPSGFLRLKIDDFQVTLRGTIFKHGNPVSALDFDDPIDRTIERHASIDVSQRIAVSSVVELNVRAYADGFDRLLAFDADAPNCVVDADDSCIYTTHAFSRWAGAEARASMDWLRDGRLVTLVGVDARVRNVGMKTDVTSSNTGAPVQSGMGEFSHTDAPLAAYVQQTWRALRWLSFNAGVRVDADDRFPLMVAPRAAVALEPWRGATLKLAYSEAFRAPSFEETEYAYPTHPDNPGLHYETVKTSELSFEQQFGTQRLTFQAFSSSLSDLIELHTYTPQEAIDAARSGQLGGIPYSPGVLVEQYRNLNDLDNHGFSVGYDGTALDRALHFGASVTGSVVTGVTPQDSPPGVSPTFFGNARVAYDLPGALPTVALAGQVLGKRLADDTNTGGFRPTPYAPGELRLRATISGAIPGVRRLSYRAIASTTVGSREPYVIGPSMTATAAQPPASLLPSPGFNAWLGAQYDF